MQYPPLSAAGGAGQTPTADSDQHHDSIQGYRRSYKACIPCRQRKSRCELGNDWAPGLPCRRCQRQMKDCVFPERRMARRASKHQQAQASRTTTATENGHSNIDISNSALGAREDTSPVGAPVSAGRDDGERQVSDFVMRTMLSNGNDALEVLFDPVRTNGRHGGAGNDSQVGPSDDASTPAVGNGRTGQSTTSNGTLRGPSRKSSIKEIWAGCRFVRSGWFTPDEAIFFVDQFFKHQQKLSPVLTDHYGKHENHFQLVSAEPLLCCTILAISSAYNPLPCPGGTMRSFFIHERLWTHLQHLLLRLLLGHEKKSKGKTRTLGTIESLLLLTEWPPRSMAFPPPVDGWDADLLVHWTEDGNDIPFEEGNEARGTWVDHVIDPAKRTAGMSWMLISTGVSLAVELGLFDVRATTPGRPCVVQDLYQPNRPVHLQRLLYLYAEQIALQNGRQSVLPQGVSHQILRNLGTSDGGDELQTFTEAWINLTKLTRTMMETQYSSPSQTSQLLRSGHYIDLVEHFRTMLESWKKRYLDVEIVPGMEEFHGFLDTEYHSARLYCHSLCIQAIIDRCAAQSGNNPATRFSNGTIHDASDLQSIEEVVHCATQVLNNAVSMADRSSLRYAPSRLTFRIISASVFLLKGLGIGVGGAKLQASLELLPKVISALRSSAVDEMHLGPRYAALLEMHLCQLQNSFVASQCAPGQQDAGGPDVLVNGQDQQNSSLSGNNTAAEDWFTLPFDTNLAMVDANSIQGFSSFENGDLDFIWNLNFDG